MNLHCDLSYTDIMDVNKVVIPEYLLSLIQKYYDKNQVPNFVNFNFEKLNIELDLKNKINIFIENTNENQATITYFCDEKKIVTFEIEYVFDIFFEVISVLQYEEILWYKENAEEIICFVLNYYPKILFYIQAYSRGYLTKLKKLTFFINLKDL